MALIKNISIIFICHNNRNINLCLNAALGQLLDNDEIIVVDDHSDSQTLALLNEYAKKNAIILIHSDKVANRSYNRNLGVRCSHNPILVFLDGDMVLGNRSLQKFRFAHESREEKAFIGNKHAINFDEYQLNLYASIPNYLDLLKTEEGRYQLEQHPMFKDRRIKYATTSESQRFIWTIYYTGLCSVERDFFELAGGFDEGFTTWGSEDVDFGYRISKLCKIGFIMDLHGFHIPHRRDVIKNELSNKQNILYMLKKYKTWEFEILANFYGYGHIGKFEYVIQQMRMLKLSELHPQIENDEIIIDSVSQDFPNGKIILYCNNILKTISSLGVAILVENSMYERAYVSDHIFIYPQLLTSRILQEALRIATHVYVYPTTDSLRIAWGDDVLCPMATKQHYGYEANDLFSYTFFPTDSHYIEVKQI